MRKVHEEGGWGSIGYRYPWKREEAEKNLLRTHTTAVSARMLHALANVSRAGAGGRTHLPNQLVVCAQCTACRIYRQLPATCCCWPSSLQQPGGFKPAKYFSIDRVFRNEALDATHLAEFHQVRQPPQLPRRYGCRPP